MSPVKELLEAVKRGREVRDQRLRGATSRKYYAGDPAPEVVCKFDGSCEFQEFTGQRYPECFYGPDCHGIMSPCRRYQRRE